MPTKREELAARRQMIVDIGSGVKDAISSLEDQYYRGRQEKRAQESHELEKQRARQIMALADQGAQRELAAEADLSRAQNARFGALAHGALGPGQGPVDPAVAKRVEHYRVALSKVADPRAKEMLLEEFRRGEEEHLVRRQAEAFARKIQSDMGLGGLSPGMAGPPAPSEEAAGALQEQAGMLLESLPSVRDPRQLMALMSGYEEMKGSLRREEEEKLFKAWNLSRLQQEISQAPDARTALAMSNLMARVQYGDLEDGESIERALRFAKAGLLEEEIAAIERMRAGGGGGGEGALAAAPALQALSQEASAAPVPKGSSRKPGQAVEAFKASLDVAGARAKTRELAAKLEAEFGKEGARAIIVEAIRQKAEQRRMEMEEGRDSLRVAHDGAEAYMGAEEKMRPLVSGGG